MNIFVKKITQAMIVILIFGLIITNPNSRQYKIYATERISKELKENSCTQLDKNSNSRLVETCKILVTSIRPQIAINIAQNTQHTNWIIFSVYKTKLQVNSLLPRSCITTIGIFNILLTYQIEEI